MTPNDLQTQLSLLLKVSAPPLIEVASMPGAVTQWTPGQRFTGEVIAAAPNGRFQVQVGGVPLDMNLPAGTQLGEKLDLTLLSLQPRLTFALSRDLQPAAQSQVSISSAARFIGTLLERAAQRSDPPAVMPAVPLLDSLPADTKSLAQALRQTLVQSGLFYEAHQAQWVDGNKSLHELQQEPQGKLPQIPQLPQRQSDRHLAASAVTPPLSNADVVAAEKLLVQPTSIAPALISDSSEHIHPQAMSMVQQQLQLLNTPQLVWQGQVWPGQQMEWRIEEHSAQANAEQEQAAWYSRLNLDLPRLGKVSALLALHGNELRLNLNLAEPSSEQTVRAGQGILQQALQDAGFGMSSIAVERDEHT